MADITTFSEVANGDRLYQTYFNSLKRSLHTWPTSDVTVPITAYNQTTGIVTLDPTRVYHFSSFTMTGGSLTISGQGVPLMIFVDGVSMIGGYVDLNGKGYAPGSGSNNSTVGQNGKDLAPDWNTGFDGGGGVGGGINHLAGTGGTFTGFSPSQIGSTIANMCSIACGAGGGGGVGAGAGTTNIGGTAGSGGGALLFYSHGNLTISGTVDLSGTAGKAGSHAATSDGAGGGGGGAGGMAIFITEGTFASGTATYLYPGGIGGAGKIGEAGTSGRGGGGGGGGASMAGTSGIEGAGSVGGSGGIGGSGTIFAITG